MKTIRQFFAIVDLQTFVVMLLALASTYLCQRFNILANIPTGLIGLAVVFPIVFSINAAYKRREDALKSFGAIRAHAVALYYVHRDWVPGEGTGPQSSDAARSRELYEKLLGAVREDLGSKGRSKKSLSKVFHVFSQISSSLETLRGAGVPTGEMSRANQYVSKMMVDFEKMRNIALFRTPISLRAYSRIFLNLFPVAFGPYFADLCVKSETFPYVGYMVAVLYSVVLVSLDNLQEDLEDPYDEVGEDDVKLDVVDDYREVFAE